MSQISRRTTLRVAGLSAVAAIGPGHMLIGAAHADTPAPSRTTPSDSTPPHRTDLEREELDRLLAVITKDKPIEPLDYEPHDLVNVDGDTYQVRAEVADHLDAMFAAAQDVGITLRVISGYRSHQTQAETHDYWVQRYGRQAAEERSARPGYSEHQSGLAVDLDDASGQCYLSACFETTDAGAWLTRHAHVYGFIKSYPPNTTERTGYIHEPWHWRYVGPRAAARMHRFKIALLQDYVDPERALSEIGLWIGRRRQES